MDSHLIPVITAHLQALTGINTGIEWHHLVYGMCVKRILSFTTRPALYTIVRWSGVPLVTVGSPVVSMASWW